jgi:hypothetical protein
MAKGVKGSSPSKESAPIRTSFIIDPVTNKKLNYISMMEEREKTDIVKEAFIDFIKKYEKKNGTIPVK